MQETVVAETAKGDKTFLINVGIDHEELDQVVAAFRRDLLTYLGVIAALLLAATWLQVRIGLKPLEAVRDEVGNIRTGKSARLAGDFPTEVQPLAEEINELLAARDVSLKKARARAGDLAHNLRTPLTVMGSLASDVERAGMSGISDAMREQTETMRRSVERELARARIASDRSTALNAPRAAVERMISAMRRMPRGNEISWQLGQLPEARVAVDSDDLLELFGNLLDNARKWANGNVRVSGREDGRSLHIVIEDDGPGVATDKLANITGRGNRLDESIQGSGLGLAIVEDLAGAYGLDISYGRSELGGLEATITFKLPDPQAQAGIPAAAAKAELEPRPARHPVQSVLPDKALK